MTITIELTPEEETWLRQKAELQGQTPEGIVHGLVHQSLFSPTAETPDLTPIPDETHEALVQRLLEIGAMTQRPTRTLGPPPPRSRSRVAPSPNR